MLDRLFSAIAARIASFARRPAAFIIAVALIVVWIVTGPAFDYSDIVRLVVNTATTIVTFLTVSLIRNSQNRDARRCRPSSTS